MGMALDKEFRRAGQEPVRTLKRDEILELIEGPRKDTFEPGVRVRGKASKDGETGWFTAKDRFGVVFAEVSVGKYYSCTATVAITDEQDIKNCKVVRKMTTGEMFTLVEGPIEDKDAGITRLKGKCLKDELEGWITVKGNAGTVYVEPSSKYYSVV